MFGPKHKTATAGDSNRAPGVRQRITTTDESVREIVLAPFKHISVHVKQAEGILLFLPDLVGIIAGVLVNPSMHS